MKRYLLLATAGTFAIGLAVTVYWFVRLGVGDRLLRSLPILTVALTATIGLTLANLSLRWFRWHFLTRRAGMGLVARESLLAYVVTLPAIATPFYVGELARVGLLGIKYRRHRPAVVGIWVLERTTDVLALCLFVGVARDSWMLFGLSGGLWILIVVLLRTLGPRHLATPSFPSLWALPPLLLITLLAWLLPVSALLLVLTLLGSRVGLEAGLEVFSYSTLLGAVTGIPLAVGVMGSSMLVMLEGFGVQVVEAALATVVFRAGTAWFAVISGGIALLLYRRSLVQLIRPKKQLAHFDELAETYRDQIPEHVRDRLLVRKIVVMERRLQELTAAPCRGLDIGCGHGWYACEIARLGYEIHGVDAALKQTNAARDYGRREGLRVHFESADASFLPFSANTFDFAYAINVIHHILDPGAQARALEEIVRVLKPGGIFFMHEINTRNPFFRFYMGYLFPLLRDIDEGDERWLRPGELRAVPGAQWSSEVDYFTFLPDFVPQRLMKPLTGLEKALESSPMRAWSAHYAACLVKLA